MSRAPRGRKAMPCPSWKGRGTACGLTILACVLLWARSSHAVGIEQLWVENSSMSMEGAPMVVDLDGDGDAEVLTAAYENMIAVDGTGRELWRFDTRGRYQTCPAILEREDASPLIYAGDNTGMFTCLDGRGTVVWQKDMAPIFDGSPALADLNGDGAIEVVQGDKSGKVSVFDALTGATIWVTQIEGECSSPAVGDLNGDGTLEIVMTTGLGKVFALDASGNIIWVHAIGGTSPDWATCSAIIFGNSAGQPCVAVASRDERFHCLDGRGNVLWTRPTRGAIASTISAGDMDGDGIADLFTVTQTGVLYRFDENGRALWDIDTQGRSLASGAIIDVDGDRRLEYVLCTQNGNLLVFNDAGVTLYNHQFDNRTINMTAAFGDIVKSRPGLEFAVTGGESGRIYCFGTSAPVDAAAQWRTYRCDNRLTGAWFGLARSEQASMTPENLSWDRLLTGDDLVFRIVNPSPDSLLKAEVVCMRPDGSRQAAVGRVVGRRSLLKMPVSVTAPGVYRFEWTLSDPSGNRLLSDSREVTLQPYVNDRALTQRAVSAVRDAIGGARIAATDRGVRAAMRQESVEIEKEAAAVAELQAAAPGATPAFGEQLTTRTVALNARAKRALVLADVAKSVVAKAPNTRVVAFEGTTWENRGVDRQLPTDIAIPLRIARRCVKGEHEPVSVKLLNVTAATAAVGAQIATQPGGPVVTAYEVKPVPSNQGTVAWDPIVPLGARTLAIPSLETREVWLDIDLANVAPGQHQVTVTFGTRPAETQVDIALDVLPFQMAGYDSMRLCAWARYESNAVEDLLAHGATVFITGVPPATLTMASTPRVDVDFANLDRFTAPLAGHDVFLLLTGIPRLGAPTADSAYVPRFAAYIGQVLARLAARGIDENHVALYPYDEPGGGGWNSVNGYVTFGRQVLKAHPGMKIYVDGGGDLPMMEAMAEVTSVWTPPYYWLRDDIPEMNLVRATGKTLWSYDCGYGYARPVGWNTKTINIAGQYRMSAPFAFNYGGTGIGYWCYNIGDSMWKRTEAEYPIVYTDSTGHNTSCRRWEAVREAMEDARILIALRGKLADPSVSPAAKAKIHHLLDVTLPGMAEQSLEEVRIGAARYVLDATNNDGTVAAFRNELLDCAAAVSQ